MIHRLTLQQKGQLALTVLLLYYPIFLYLLVPLLGQTWQSIRPLLPFFITEGIAIFLVYFFWISVSEWILERLFKTFGQDFLSDFNIPALVITVFICLLQSIAFISVYRSCVGGIDNLLRWSFAYDSFIPFPLQGSEETSLFFKRSSNGFFLMLMLAGFYLIANRKTTLQMEEISLKAERLEKENVQSQFEALKNQVNPHFLFNSLSILSSLVYVSADLSEKFIDQLSKAYRYILEQKDKEQVLLKTEIDFIESYVFLLKIRFEEKFKVTFAIPPAYLTHYAIAPLTLQLLVENAVKHNQMSEETPLQVYIEVDQNDLVVRNNLRPRPLTEASTGVGLQNIINRYELLSERKVWVGESDGNFIVRIPLLIPE